MQDHLVLNLSQYDRFKSANLTKTELNQAANFIKGLLRESYLYNYDFHDFLPRARNWFAKVYGKSVATNRRFLKKLINSGLVEEDTNYTWTGNSEIKGDCKSYRINPSLRHELLEIVSFDNKYAKPPQANNSPACRYQRKVLRELRTTIKTKEIKKGLNGFLGEIVTKDYVLSRIDINNQITGKILEIDGKYYKKSRYVHEQKAKGNFVYKSNLKIGVRPESEYNDFIEEQRRVVSHFYANHLLNLKYRRVSADIDVTNGRIYTNYTHLPSKRTTNKGEYPALIDLFTLGGERLYTIDLKQSQITFAFKQMLDELDATLYQIAEGVPLVQIPFKWVGEVSTARNVGELVKDAQKIKSKVVQIMRSGSDFYLNFSRILKAKKRIEINRSKAKRMVFEVIFSGISASESKSLIKIAYPEFVAFVDCYKRRATEYFKNLEMENPEMFQRIKTTRSKNRSKRNKQTNYKTLGSSAFAVKLQKIETGVFIDRVSENLRIEGMKHLTKHDSITVKESDLPLAKKMIEEALNDAIGYGLYELRVETPKHIKNFNI